MVLDRLDQEKAYTFYLLNGEQNVCLGVTTSHILRSVPAVGNFVSIFYNVVNALQMAPRMSREALNAENIKNELQLATAKMAPIFG